MKIIKNPSTDPYFNLACEEYLLDNIGGDIFMLWRNERSVIIGKSQNAYAELDRSFIDAHGIKVVRRLTGGGAVFHDIGNVNYTFITESGGTLDFARFCAPVIAALNALGVNAELSGRNDLTANGLKISGTAQCVRNGRTLHHGTLLFDADLAAMAGALKPDPDKLKSKGIGSVRSRVTNLRELIDRPLDTPGFAAFVEGYVTESFEDSEIYRLSPDDTAAIQALSDTKYSTWDWNYGASREYSHRTKRRFPYGSVTLEYTSERGVISDIRITGDFFGTRDISGLEDALRGRRLERSELTAALSEVGAYIAGAGVEDIAEMI